MTKTSLVSYNRCLTIRSLCRTLSNRVIPLGISLLLLLILEDGSRIVQARTWEDISTYHDSKVDDYDGLEYLRKKEQQYQLDAFQSVSAFPYGSASLNPVESIPSSYPSIKSMSTGESTAVSLSVPTSTPLSGQPTHAPIIAPTRHPTKQPVWKSPTDAPTTKRPTFSPSITPTVFVDPFEPAMVPINPDRWYFNYNNSTDSKYGPGELGLVEENGMFHVGIKNNHWRKVSNPPNYYWQEFTNSGWGPWQGTFGNDFFLNNDICEKGKLQSPIDLRDTSKCVSNHEVRSLRGDFKLKSNDTQKLIQSNKLRLVFRRRPCGRWNDPQCQEPDPPHGDFPNGWGGYADGLHVDVKVPGEHSIEGEKFDGEMQIFHLHAGKKRFPVQSVLIRAIDNDRGYNYYFQALLDAFQFEYNKNAIRCGIIHPRRTRNRRLSKHYHNEKDNMSQGDDFIHRIDRFNDSNSTTERQLQELIPFNSVWDPYHPLLIPSIWFYRYDGSFTEPPCTEVVTWFVADKPMIISVTQLIQLKLLILTNVDAKCQKTSVHFGRSVARPLRQLNNRPVQKCTSAHYGPDPVPV